MSKLGIMAGGVSASQPGLVGYNWTDAGPGSLTVPTHQNGDLLLFCETNSNSSSSGTPSTQSGFTSIANGSHQIISFPSNLYYNCRLQYRISDGTIGSITLAHEGGVVFVARGFASARGAFQRTSGLSGVTTLDLPDLSGLNTGGTSLLIASDVWGNRDITAVSSPFVLTGTDYGIVENNTASSSGSGKSLTQAASTGNVTFVAELLV